MAFYMNAYMLRIEAMNSFIIQGYIILQKCRPELTDFFILNRPWKML